jgi:hypothetical protein
MYTFGDWFADADARSVAQDFIRQTAHGNPAVPSQMAIFQLDPWEGAACPGSSTSPGRSDSPPQLRAEPLMRGRDLQRRPARRASPAPG